MRRPEDEFGIWFRAFLRRKRLTYQQFAEEYGLDVYAVELVAADVLIPSKEIQNISGIQRGLDVIIFDYGSWVELCEEVLEFRRKSAEEERTESEISD